MGNLAPVYIEQLGAALSIFKVPAPTIQPDCPSIAGTNCAGDRTFVTMLSVMEMVPEDVTVVTAHADAVRWTAGSLHVIPRQ